MMTVVRSALLVAAHSSFRVLESRRIDWAHSALTSAMLAKVKASACSLYMWLTIGLHPYPVFWRARLASPRSISSRRIVRRRSNCALEIWLIAKVRLVHRT
jgi:hypothetical protein